MKYDIADIAIIIFVVALSCFAIFKEVAFFKFEEHAFGKGSFEHAISKAGLKDLATFSSKLIYWRKSLIIAIPIIGIVYIFNKSGCLQNSMFYILSLFVIVAALLYFQNSFYSFHLYRHIAERIGELVKKYQLENVV